MRRIAAWISLLTCSLAIGCSSVKEVPISEALDSGERVSALVRPSGEIVEFNDEGGVINTYRGTIDGVTVDGKSVSIPITETHRVWMKQTDTTKTVVWTAVGLGAAAALITILLYLIW